MPRRELVKHRSSAKDGIIENGHDADHGLDLQYGGTDSLDEIISTQSRVNRSVGGQGKARMNYPDGTPIKRFVEEP